MVSDPSFERLECSTTRLDGGGQQLRPGSRRGRLGGPCIVIALARRRHIVSTTVAQAIYLILWLGVSFRTVVEERKYLLYLQDESGT